MNAYISSLLNDVDSRAEQCFTQFKERRQQSEYAKTLEERLICAYSLKPCTHVTNKNQCSMQIIAILEECEKYFEFISS